MRIGKLVFDETVRAKTNSLILGSPGFGKSRLLEYLQRRDIENRRPFFSMDYHGSLDRNMIAWCAANSYYDRRIHIVNLSDGTFAKGVGLFNRIPEVDIGAQTSGMTDAVLSASGDKDPGSFHVIQRLLKIVFTCLLEKGMMLHECITLLSDKHRLDRMVETLEDSLIRSAWTDISKQSPSEWGRYVAPTINRLFRIVQSKSIQRFLSLSRQGYDLELTFKDTIFINLAVSDKLDAMAARTFGALWLNHCYLLSKKRKGKFGKDPDPYYGYVDEWVHTPTEMYGRTLAETRKFGLLLVLANQDLSQIRANFGEPFQESLLTLCQFQACFGGLNHADASRLGREWNVPAETIKALKERECLIKLPRQPVTLVKMPQVDEPYISDQRVGKFIQRIAERTGALPVEEVDRLLSKPNKECAPKEFDPDE